MERSVDYMQFFTITINAAMENHLYISVVYENFCRDLQIVLQMIIFMFKNKNILFYIRVRQNIFFEQKVKCLEMPRMSNKTTRFFKDPTNKKKIVRDKFKL